MSDVPHRLASQSRIDRAIDRAVRDIMQVDPRPGFRRRVMERLEPEPIRSSIVFRIALATGAVALLVVALMLVVPNRRSPLPTGISSTTTQQAQTGPHTAGPPRQPTHETASVPPERPAPLDPRPIPRRSGRPTAMPRVANVFGDRNSAVAAASVAADTVWPAPAPETHEDRNEGLPPLVIPSVQPPAPIVIPPINARGPGLDH
jgi:hypothetical protein